MRSIKLFFAALLIPALLAADAITVNFKETPIADVIRFVAKQSGQNILIPYKISGTVNFVSQHPIDKQDLIPLLTQILLNRGYTLVDTKKGYLTVTRAANAKRLATPERNNEAGMVTRIIPVHYIKARDAVQKLRYLTSQFAAVTYDDKKNIVILTDYPQKIEIFEKTLHSIDHPMQKRIRFIPLTNADAAAAAKELNTIFKALAETFRFPVTIKADAKSNKLILIADRHDIDKAAKIVEDYDAQNSAKKVVSDVIFLNNAEAAATVKIINGLLKSFDKQTQQHLAIEAKEDINAIAVTGSSEAVKLITKVIKKLDIEQEQVYVKAHIYEISQRKVQNLGVRWGMTGGTLTDNTLITSVFNMGGSSFVLPAFLSDAIKLEEGKTALAVGAMIDLLKQNGAVNVVSEPNILCINNKKSSVYVGKTISILTSTVQGNQTTDLARNTYSREDIGLTLEVKPQIASDDKVLMEVKAKVEDIDQANTKEVDRPTTLKREVSTVSIVHNGESVIIGGLLKDYYAKGVNKVPLLGDLPFLGALFTSTNNTKDQINLIVVLTPYIVKNSASLAKIQEQIAKKEELKAKLAEILGKKLQARNRRFEKEEKHRVQHDIFNR